MAVEARLLEAMEDSRRRIPEVIRALMAGRRAKGPDVAAAIGMSASSFYARLNGKSMIQAHELTALALYFGVPVSFFYDPPAGLLGKDAEALARTIGGYFNSLTGRVLVGTAA
jgi:transcriptional regulator with XRE-family HTH domain